MCMRMYVPVCVDVCVAREGERKPRKSNIPKESAMVVLCVFLFGRASPHAGLFIPSHVTAQHIRASALPYVSVHAYVCVYAVEEIERARRKGGGLAREEGKMRGERDRIRCGQRYLMLDMEFTSWFLFCARSVWVAGYCKWFDGLLHLEIGNRRNTCRRGLAALSKSDGVDNCRQSGRASAVDPAAVTC